MKKYKGYTIEYNPKPIPSRAFDHDYWHEDYDGGTAESIYGAMCDIDILEDERVREEKFKYSGPSLDQPHHVIVKATGRVLENTKADTWHESIQRYRQHYANDRVCVMYDKGYKIVPVKGDE